MDGPEAIIVDDEAAIRVLGRRALERDHWTVHEASSGLEALRLVEEHPDVSLLVTDVQMPEMSGLRLAAIVRRARPDIKVLYVTGFSDRVFEERPALPSEEAFLEKPFGPKALTEAASLLVFGKVSRPEPDPRR
jgi:two-component system cell cycle sensor histidine kinase/response regulator CckA